MTLGTDDIQALQEIRARNRDHAADRNCLGYGDSPQAKARVHRALLRAAWPVRARRLEYDVDWITPTEAGKILSALERDGLIERQDRSGDTYHWRPTTAAFCTSLARRFPPEHEVRKQVVAWLSIHVGDLKNYVRSREIAKADPVEASSKVIGLCLKAMYRRPAPSEPVTVTDATSCSSSTRYRVEQDR